MLCGSKSGYAGSIKKPNKIMKKKRRLLSVTRSTVKKSVYLIVGLLLAFPAWAQAANEKVTLNARRQSVVEIFKELEKQSTYRFMYHDADLLRMGLKDINVRDVPLTDALDVCLAGSNITYEIVGNQIIFKRTEAQQPQASTRQLTGTVVNAAGNPVAGATVLVEGTRTGTITDAGGRFTLTIPAGRIKVAVSFMGFATRNIDVETQTDIRVVLEEATVAVGEVVVTGYATIDKGLSTGATTTIRADDILTPGQTIDQMLQGVVSGMSVLNVTGKVGGTPKIRIRGTSTIMGNKEPLWVVDGVIQRDPLPIPDQASPLYSEMAGLMETAGNAISWLNPNDIETITVLKDASSTAIYGSQASNGVIVITTKKATAGQGLAVSYSGDFSVGQRPRYAHYDIMNSQQQMQFSQQMWEDRDSYNGSVLPVGFGEIINLLQDKQITEERYAELFHELEMNNTDWFDLLFRNSFSQRHNVSVSGAGNRVQSRFSVGIDRQNGEARGNDLTGLTASSSTTFRIDDKVIIDLNLNGSFRETEDFAFGVSPFDYAMNTSRTIPLYDQDGSLHYHLKQGAASPSIPNRRLYGYNILNERDNTGARNMSMSLNSSLNVQVKITEGLNFRGMISYTVAGSRQKSWATEFSNYITNIRGYEAGEIVSSSNAFKATPLPFGGVLVRNSAFNNDYMLRGSVDYNRIFNGIHRLMLQLGAEVNSRSTNGAADTRYGYLYYRGETFAPIPRQLTPVEGAATPNPDALFEAMRLAARMVTTKDNKMSQYFTAIYGFRERYIMNFNARLDASNRFGQDQNKKFNPSWSMGLKWRVGNEAWMDWAAEWLYMLDLSASYGWRGNAVQQVSPYMIASDAGLHQYYQDYTLNIKSLPYPNLGWERKQDWNVGLDFSFFEGRLTATANAYGSRANVLASREVPIENGVTTAYIAGTIMKNHGYDLNVSLTPLRTKDFFWSLSFNAAKEFSKMRDNQRENTQNDYLNGSAIVDGYAYGSFWSYEYIGLDGANGRPLFRNTSKTRMETVSTNPLDWLVLSGNTEPDFFGGLMTSFGYKDLRLNMSFAVSFGAQKRLPAFYPSYGAPTPDRNAPLYMLDRWRKPGDELHTDVPSIPGSTQLMYVFLPSGNAESPYQMYNQSDFRIADSDFIRCRNIALQYSLPHSILDQFSIKRATVSASMANPFVIALDKSWGGYDPETGGWPARRTVSFSLNLSF